MDRVSVARSITRLSHEIIESIDNSHERVLIGIHNRGVPLANRIQAEILNINGGACALGHPVGASGARIVATLINSLKSKNLKRGIASLCIGGGEATAMSLELID